MEISKRKMFFSKFATILLVFLLNNRTALSSERLMEMERCKVTNKKECSIIYRDCDLGSQNGVAELKKIFEAKGKKCKTCTLIFERCTHKTEAFNIWEDINPNNNSKIDDLKIFHSSIDINKLNLKIFKNLLRLKMENTTTKSLQLEVFRKLPNLQRLQLKGNIFLKEVENGFLQNLTLDYLQIQRVNLNQIETAQFFKNLTGEREISSVRELDWSHNNFGNFPRSFLVPFSNLNVLFLTNSSISDFENETFSNKKFQRVYINKNKISRLPEKIFRPLLESGSFVSLEGNQLICDCEMEWVQSWAKKKPELLRIDCAIPKEEFLKVEMCPEINSKSSRGIHCNPKENSEISDDYNMKKSSKLFNKTSKRFKITNEEPEFIEISLSETVDLERAFLWYGNYENATSPQFSCLKVLQQIFGIHVKPDVNYLMCLTTVHKYYQIDITDCLPVKTKPLYEDQPWLTKKSIVLSVICILVVFLFALTMGALILYLSVRKNPSLIRGSKRVIEVKRHDKAQILIMPRGYKNSSFAPTGPSLPLQPSRSYDTISTVSYVSANQPTQLEILTYRFNRLRELFQKNNNIPSTVSSLPMKITTPINQRLPPNVDLLLEYEWYTITTTTTTQV